jgi:transcriptional regulator GlxA family with amidase domain
LDVTGPFDVFRRVNAHCEKSVYDLVVVGVAERTVPTLSGLGFVGHASLEEAAADGLPHTVVLGGGDPKVLKGTDEARLAEWLREHAPYIPRIGSICSGAFILGEAGLLDGRRATTHWILLDSLRERFPKARVVDDALFVNDDRVWTSAGVTSGIDMSLAMVEEDLGHEVSLAVARFLVLYLRRSGSQRQFSTTLAGQATERRSLRDLQAHIVANLKGDLSIERLAAACSMSARNFSRVFKNDLGMSPGSFVRAVRLDEARRLLESTDFGIAEIAARIGSGDESTLRRWFIEQFGISPVQYRERFESAGRVHAPIATSSR